MVDPPVLLGRTIGCCLGGDHGRQVCGDPKAINYFGYFGIVCIPLQAELEPCVPTTHHQDL